MHNLVEVTLPKKCKDFECIGGKCEDTCCKEWDIEIDKDTFNDYSKVKNSSMSLMIKDSIIKNDDCTGYDLDYGIIRLNDKKRCPFLDDKNLCMIYSKIGKEYLSNICTHYPRILNKIDNKYEISLDVSCPEAARLILNEKERTTFISCEKDLNKYIINCEYNTNSKKVKNSPIKYIKEIRKASIDIIQNRDFNFANRLYILGDFLKKLEEVSQDNCRVIPEFINRYSVEKVANLYNKDKTRYIFQIAFFKNIIDYSKLYENTLNGSFKRYTKQILINFDINNIEKLKENTEYYINLFIDYDKSIIRKYEYIFENYIVNFMYNNLFPFSESDNMFEGYIMLVIRYSFIRLYLVSLYMNNKDENLENIIKVIVSFTRTIEHDKSYLSNMLKYVKEQKYDNFNFVKKLI